MQEMQVSSLGWEDPLGKEMATHPSILAWRTPWKEEPGGLQSMGSQRVGHDLVTQLQQQFITITCLLEIVSTSSTGTFFSVFILS